MTTKPRGPSSQKSARAYHAFEGRVEVRNPEVEQLRQFLLELGVERLKDGARLLLFRFGLYAQ